MPVRDELIDFSDMSGGKNNAFPRHALQKNQVYETLNAIHETVGISRAPGYKGFVDWTGSGVVNGNAIRGEFNYTLDDGTEYLIIVVGLKIFTINTSTGTPTQIGTVTADTQCYAVNAAGKLWIVNGTDFVKVESDLSVYRVQIVAPASITACNAGTSGTLAAGVYGVYYAYARKNAAGQYFYSLPYSVGNKTVSASGSLQFVFIPSTDPQVNKIVVFLTDSNGAVPYYYGEFDNDGSIYTITSNADRNALVLMSTVSASNQILPITPNGIYTYDDKLYVWDINDRTVYWSLKTDVNPFDMERFLAQNFRTMSYAINSVFSIDEDLFFNHTGNGISKAIAGDMSSVIKRVQKKFWFLDCNTPDGKSNVVYYKGVEKESCFGLTNDGFRFFDGENFSEDVSFHIKPDVDAIYAGLSASYVPSAVIYRRPGKRTEYRFSYRNLAYGSTMINDQRIFNMDFYFDPLASKKTWECWENGFSFQAVVGGVWYGVQSWTFAPFVVKENGVTDIDCLDRTGALRTTTFVKQLYILTRTFIDDLDSITFWGKVYALASSNGTISGNVVVLDANYAKYPFSIAGTPASGGVMPAGGGLVLPFVMLPQYPVGSSTPTPFNARGNSVALEIEQTQDDSAFILYKLQLPRAKQVKNNLT